MARADLLGYFLNHLSDATSLVERSDADLVAHFRATRDEASFTELVRRHGPLVYRTCMRMLHDSAQAEDAFQAVFLVLYRRVSAIDTSRPLGAWMYGVAVRVASKARARREKRASQELRATMLRHDQSPEVGWSDWNGILDEELGRLSVSDREIIVLCDLQGVSHRTASDQLGCPPGSVSRRLAAAREALRDRLVRRGIALSTPALVLGLAKEAGAGMPPSMCASVIEAMTAPSAPVEELVSSVLTDSTRSFWTKSLLSLMAVGGLASLGTWLATDSPTPLEAPKPPTMRVVEVVRPELPDTAWKHEGSVRAVGFAPDGTHLVSSAADGKIRVWDSETGKVVRSWDGPKNGALAVAVSNNGKWVASEEPLAGLMVREIQTGRVVRRLPALNVPVSGMTFGREDGLLAIIGDQKCRVYFGLDSKPLPEDELKLEANIEMERCIKATRLGKPYQSVERVALRMAPNGKSLLLARWWDNRLAMFAQPLDKNAGPSPIHALREKVRPPVTAVGFSADATKIVWSDDGGRVRIVGLAEGELLYEHRNHRAAVVSLVCQDNLVVSADADGVLYCIREGSDGRFHTSLLLGEAKGVTGLAIRPGGKELAVASSDHRIRRWDLTTGVELGR